MKIKIVILLILALNINLVAQEIISIESLLNEMVNRDEKARFPSPIFSCKQSSSYDRRTKVKGEEGWFSNWDRSNFIGVEKKNGRTEFIMMDAKGPGAIVRFWMTFSGENSGSGTMRIYIDDMAEPAIEGSAIEILSGNIVAGEPLSSFLSKLTRPEKRAYNLYFPIPYSERCKVTYQSERVSEDDFGAKKDSTECVYYSINYRAYEPGTEVIPYSPSQMKKNKKLISNVQAILLNKELGLGKQKLSKVNLSSDLAPDKSKSFTIDGANAIKHIGMKLEATNKEQALRSIVLEISFDGQRTVWAPVGDFFGIGCRQLYTNTWNTTATEDGKMDAYWVMPFKGNCTITLNNYGKEEVRITDAIAEYDKWKWDSRSMLFGSSWHQYSGIDVGGIKPMSGDSGGIVDVNYVSLNGRGVYVGDGVTLFNTSYHWWGEGDEKIYIDEEAFPSHIGTGTEDYYGYAWCRHEKIIGHPFIAQPEGTGNNQPGYSSNTRLRGLDIIPFSKSLIFDMGLFHWGQGKINYAPITFWYIMPGGGSTIAPDIEGVQHKIAMSRSDVMSDKVILSIEAEFMNLISKDGGSFRYQGEIDLAKEWSNKLQIYWRKIRQGNRLTMDFESNWGLTCDISAICTMMKGYGVFNVYLNGKKIKTNLNLFSETPQVKELNLGRGALVKGKNQFTFEMVEPATDSEIGALGIDKFIFN